MKWFIPLFLGRVLKKGLQQQMRTPNRTMLGRGTLMSLLAIGAVAYGVARRNGGGGNFLQKIIPFRFIR